MKYRNLFFIIFVPILLNAQINESFSDGNFTENPTWAGTDAAFLINVSGELQSCASASSLSYLFTPSESFDNAVWECKVKITYSTSSYNYASIYIASDVSDLTNGCNGYYVQVGGTNDEVSLFVQQGTEKTKIIDGMDKRTDGNPVEIQIKVTRDADGNFELFSRLPSESEYISEGKIQHQAVKNSTYFGLFYSNTSTTGSDYYFDDVIVTGDKALDLDAPLWMQFSLEEPNKLNLEFNEKVDIENAFFEVDNEMGEPDSVILSTDEKIITLVFDQAFEKGKVYTLSVSGLTDLSGNELVESSRSIGVVEPIEMGDLVWNEVMFENPETSYEYVEVYNKSAKVIDLSQVGFTTRKTDGTLNSLNNIPEGTYILPEGYLALSENADVVRSYHNCPVEANVIATEWSTLNNESATLVLCNLAKDTVYDELTYNENWHHVLVKNPKGVALERINADLATQDSTSWHSAASEVQYGTPGYKNSQFRVIENVENSEQFVWLEPEAFSPDNDGINDVCFVRYKIEKDGYVANVLILNSVGVNICKLGVNVLLGSDGFLIWDGKTDKGQNANVGIYVLYFEIFNPETGDKKVKKLPVVVSSR